MEYLAAGLGEFLISTATNISYALLFLYHFLKRNTNNSLMILAGCLCMAMVFNHFFISYKLTLDKDSAEYFQLVLSHYTIWALLNGVVILTIQLLHRLIKVPYHYVVRYVFRCLCLSIVLNLAVHVDIIMLENRESNALWTVYSYGENILNVFTFFSVLIARQWSEVFRWLQLAHAR